MSKYEPPKTARETALQIHEYLFNDEPVEEEITEMERIILRLIEYRQNQHDSELKNGTE